MNNSKTKNLKIISFLIVALILLSNISFGATIKPTSDSVVSDTLVDYNMQNGGSSGNTIDLPVSTNSLSYAVNTRLQENPYNNFEDKLKLHSSSGILIDLDVNKILYEKNAYQKMYPASTTKVLTAILTIEKCDLNAEVLVSYWAVHSVGNNYSKAKVAAGEILTVNDLLASMMVGSANDSAYVLAQYMANDCSNTYPSDSSDESKVAFEKSIASFGNMMTNKAKEIGCINSNFVNPNGMHADNHYSCAYDLALIGQYAYSKDTIKKIGMLDTFTLPNTDKYTGNARTESGTNLLMKQGKATYYEYCTGLKTGYTSSAKSCLIATAEKGDRRLLCVVLYSDGTDREADCKTLFEYGFNKYEYSVLASKDDVAQTISMINATSDTRELNAIVKDDIKILINKDEDKTIDINPETSITKRLAPVKKGDVIGKISYTVNGVKYESVLIAEHDVEVRNYFIYIGIIVGIFFILLIIVIIIEKRK